MTTLRIVQLQNGRYAVQSKESWGSMWEFCEGSCGGGRPKWGRTWGTGRYYPEHVEEYCLMPSVEEAEMVLEKTIEALRKKRGKPLAVVKVIRTVRV